MIVFIFRFPPFCTLHIFYCRFFFPVHIVFPVSDVFAVCLVSVVRILSRGFSSLFQSAYNVSDHGRIHPQKRDYRRGGNDIDMPIERRGYRLSDDERAAQKISRKSLVKLQKSGNVGHLNMCHHRVSDGGCGGGSVSFPPFR